MRRTAHILWLLAACGSGSSSGSNGVSAPDFDAFQADILGRGVTFAAQMPTTGSADYSGLVQLNLPVGGAAPQTYLGTIDVTVIFDATAPVTGELQGFTGLSGTLTVSDGVITPDADPDAEFQFFADVAGTLSTSGAAHDLDGSLAGDFYGPGAGAIAGVVFGDITTGGDVDIFDGAFAAEATP